MLTLWEIVTEGHNLSAGVISNMDPLNMDPGVHIQWGSIFDLTPEVVCGDRF